MRREGGGGRGEEGGMIFGVCFNDFEGGRVDGGEGECLFSFFTQIKRFVMIHVGLWYFTQIPLCMHFITIYKIKYYINLFNNFKNI